MGTTITRRGLYHQVWQEPMTRLATTYGLSNVGLAKICRKHDIPCPPRGYWAKKQFGQKPAKIPLPEPGRDYDILMRDPNQSQTSPPESSSEVEQRVAAERQPDLRIEVAESLRGSHELVTQANNELQAARVGDNGLVTRPENSTLDVWVSKASLRRALLIMDALLKALERRGYLVAPGPSVQILEFDIGFSIAEGLETKREEPDGHDLDGRYSFGHSRFNRKTVPSGRLVLRICDSEHFWARGCRQTWRDGTKQRLEDHLNKFVAGLIEFAACLQQHNAELIRQEQERLAAEQRRQVEARRRAERRELIKAERARVDALTQQAKNWKRSQNLREFIEASKRKHLVDHGEIEPGSEFAQWFNWAIQQANRLDPFCESPPSLLDENASDS